MFHQSAAMFSCHARFSFQTAARLATDAMCIDKCLDITGNESGDSSNLDVWNLAVRRFVVQRPDTDAQRPSRLSFVPKPHVLRGAAKLCVNISHTSRTGCQLAARPSQRPPTRKNAIERACGLRVYQI